MYSVHMYACYCENASDLYSLMYNVLVTGVQPDIVTVGKPMGNGHPISAVVTTEKIASDFLAKHPDIQGEVNPTVIHVHVYVALQTEFSKLSQPHNWVIGDCCMLSTLPRSAFMCLQCLA